jgi:hypothetical protein
MNRPNRSIQSEAARCCPTIIERVQTAMPALPAINGNPYAKMSLDEKYTEVPRIARAPFRVVG